VLPALHVFQQASEMKLINGENFFYVKAKTRPFFGSTSVFWSPANVTVFQL